MGLVSKSIPNLINGVSQQPAALRLESQGEVQENGFSDVVDGLKKRPPTKFLKQLKYINSTSQNSTNLNARTDYVNLTGLETAFFHTYKRSDDEQYHVIIRADKTVLVYDIDGNLRYQSGNGSWNAAGNLIVTNDDITTYLPIEQKNITATSVADATFIVNKDKTVAMSNVINPANDLNQALVYLKSVNYGRDYTVKMTSKLGTVHPSADHTTVKQVTETVTNVGDQVNSDELKVSSVMSETRNGNACLRDEIDNDLGGVVTSEFSRVESDWWNGITTTILDKTVSGMTLTNSNATAGKYVVTVGSTTVPYDSSGNNGWKIINSTKLRLPTYVVTVDSNYGEPLNVVEAGSVRYTANQSTTHGFITPVTSNNEPYFIINTPNTGGVGDFDIQVTDDDGGVNLKAFKGNAKSFTDLPNQCTDGMRLGVVGDNQKKEDDFHVVFKGEGGSGYWKETVGYNLKNYFDLTTMPHTLKQNADLSFTFGQGEWDERKAGDDNTNPAPSFVGNTITDIFFHRNRLGVLAGENVIFSEASGYYNFWRTTVRTLLDADPIDVAVSQNEVSELKAAVPIQDNLLLFSNLNQFTLSATQLLTPAEVTVDQSTKYECDLTASPVGAGNSVFFATKSGDYAGVREFFTRDDTEIKDATDISSHVPEYIKGNIRQFAASSNEDMLVALTNSDKNECYIYKWYNSATERLQSSWSKWTFKKPIGSVFFNNAELFFTFTDGSYEKMSLTASSSAITVTETPTSSANNIYFTDSFGGVDYDTIHYLPQSGTAESWGGWATPVGSGHQIQLPYGGVLTFYARIENDAQDVQNLTFVLENAPYPNNNPSVTLAPKAITGGLAYYEIEIDPQNPAHIFTNIIMRASGSPNFSVSSVQLTANQGLVKGSEQDVLLDHRKYILGAQTPTQLTTWGITPTSRFVNHKGIVVGQGNTTTELQKVSTYLNGTHFEINDHNGDGTLTNEEVDNYVYVGEPYTFKFQMSEQVFKPAQGDVTRLARLQLRKVSFSFNDTGYFEVDVKSTGRDNKKVIFTGRTLGQIDNLLGYSAVVQDGTKEVGIQSQASETNITITNDTHLPCIFQSAEWEGFVTLRNQRL